MVQGSLKPFKKTPYVPLMMMMMMMMMMKNIQQRYFKKAPFYSTLASTKQQNQTKTLSARLRIKGQIAAAI